MAIADREFPRSSRVVAPCCRHAACIFDCTLHLFVLGSRSRQQLRRTGRAGHQQDLPMDAQSAKSDAHRCLRLLAFAADSAPTYVLCAAMLVVYFLMVLAEEPWLEAAYGEPYRRYRNLVPDSSIGDGPRLWRAP